MIEPSIELTVSSKNKPIQIASPARILFRAEKQVLRKNDLLRITNP